MPTPREGWTRLVWIFGTVQFLVGALLGGGWRQPLLPLAIGIGVVLLLQTGSMALEAAWGPEGVPPRFLAPLGFVLLGASLISSTYFLRQGPSGRYVFEIAMTCGLASLLHSMPPIRLGRHAGWSLLLRGTCFGFFPPMAGWCAAGGALGPGLVELCLGFLFLLPALDCVQQIGLQEDVTSGGHRTLVGNLGVPRSLTYALGAVVVAHLYFLQALLRHHRSLSGTAMTSGAPSPALLVMSLAAWLGLLLPWRLRWNTWTAAQVEGGRFRALAAWAITDATLLASHWPRG